MEPKMLIIALISLVFYIVTSHAAPIKSPFVDVCGKQVLTSRNRIFGGNKTDLSEFPWMVQIRHARARNTSIAGCSGFIIHKQFILTAAHCVSKSILDVYGPIREVVLGEYNTANETDFQMFFAKKVISDPPVYAKIKPKKTIIHKEYTDSPLNRDHQYDLALLQLRKPINYTKFIQPICLAEETTSEDTFYISGWGSTESERSSNDKLKAEVPRADHDACIETYDTKDIYIDESQICAGGIAGIDSCTGDSGGPLMVQVNFTWYAEGIVSFGKDCGVKGWPGVYTNIPYYIDWIKTRITKRLESDRKIAEQKNKH